MTKTPQKTGSILIVAAVCLVLATASGHAGQQYAALEDVSSVSAVFDLKTATPQRTARYLDLMHELLKDEALTAISERPALAVVIAGQAIRHIAPAGEDVSQDDRQAMDQIASRVSAMTADGIAVEACLIAAASAGVDPASFVPGVTPVGNGWISLIGYQAKGYSLVPVY